MKLFSKDRKKITKEGSFEIIDHPDDKDIILQQKRLWEKEIHTDSSDSDFVLLDNEEEKNKLLESVCKLDFDAKNRVHEY